MKQQVEIDSPLMRKLIREYIPQANEHCQNQFVRYYELLIDYNNRMNLTAITDPFGIVQRHFADSLLGEKLIPNGSKCIDVGTGAGFPGIPLAILFPDTHFHLVDSIGKKVKVATEIAQAIGLKNVTTRHCRAEEEKQQFDFVVSRAVMPLTDLLKIIRKNIRKEQHNALPNGLICLKGGELDREVMPVKHQTLIYDLKDYFEEEFFETKKVVYVTING